MTQQTVNLRQQIKNLRDQLKALRDKHEFTILQLSQTKENEEKLKKINDALTKTIQNNTINLPTLQDINIVIDGQLTSNRIAQLERQLDYYRSGANASVDRRVRQIVKQYSYLEEQEKSKSRLSYGDRNNVSINYNLFKKQKPILQPCQTCIEYRNQLKYKNTIIEEFNIQLEEMKADRDILKAKLSKVEALVETLKKQNKLLESQLVRLQNELDSFKLPEFNLKWQNNDRTYMQDKPDRTNSRLSYGLGPSDCKDKQNMIRQISNIVNVLSNRKQAQERGKSKVMPVRDSNTLFSIKNGINRPNQIYF